MAQTMKKSEEPAFTPPTRTILFVAVRRAVMRGSECIAECKSHTFARRVAEALNRYTPNRKGY